jgi:hypothetical protein
MAGCGMEGGYRPEVYIRLGHLIFNPSNHRMYSSSAMGDLRVGDDSSLLTGDGEGATE